MTSDQILKSLRIVVIQNPFEQWKNSFVPDLFKGIIELKRLGYEGYYPNGFLPVETVDFVGTHILMCQETNGELRPIAGYKSITATECETYHMPYPGFSALERDEGTELHKLAVGLIFHRHFKEQKKLTFASSWTVLPEFRRDPGTITLLKELTGALFVHYKETFQLAEELAFGVPKIKSDKFFTTLGYKPIELDGQQLPTIKHQDIGGEDVVLMHRADFTDIARSYASKFESLWNNRIEIASGERTDSTLKKTG